MQLCFPFMMLVSSPEIKSCFQTAFFDAVQRYDHESLKAFFSVVSNEDAAHLLNDQGCSALHIAVKAGRSGVPLHRELTNRSGEGVD